MVQGELFREDTNYNSNLGTQKSFLSRYQITLRLDKIILLMIGMMFVFTLSHTFGMERGKRLMEKKYEALIPSQVQTLSQPEETNDPTEALESETVLMVNQGKPAPSAQKPLQIGLEAAPLLEGPIRITSERTTPLPPTQATVTPTPSELKKLGNFTVQLVTYDSKTMADKEIDRLKSKGYEGFIIPSGRFFQVCANYFDDKSKARSHLEELKQTGRYPGAYVRPVIR